MGTTVVAVLAGAACEFCGVSCPKAGEIGPPTSVTAKMAANNGRADSVFIVLLTLEIMSPKGLNLILLIPVKRLQNGICFTPSAVFGVTLGIQRRSGSTRLMRYRPWRGLRRT